MMAGQTRDLLPWEARCGCPRCKVKPGQRCVTLDTRYPLGTRGYELMLGSPTTAHKARYRLWCWLWCRTACNPHPQQLHQGGVMIDREAVECTLCWAQPGFACEFVDGPAPMVDDNGTKRRAVHATRYADSLPPEERGPFWENAVDRYLSTELERMNVAAPSASEEP